MKLALGHVPAKTSSYLTSHYKQMSPLNYESEQQMQLYRLIY